MSKYRIVLDYGHGGSKPGAVYGGIEEKTVNLLTGQELNRRLHSENGGSNLQVLLTRDADYDISLRTRCALINAHHKEDPIQLVLSVHYNAAGTPAAAGFEAFCVATSPTGPIAAEEVARAVRQAGMPVRANTVRTTAQLGKRLAILHDTVPPAILVEVGFLTNPVDRGNAANPLFHSAVAQAITHGIWNYLKREEN
ncbi:MAG: N-acetylmuramoyl-L-alanine amidase [Candidatus Neomarinimicrobiota bacterium]